MHELGIVKHIFQTVQELKVETGAAKICSVTLLVGEGRGYVEKWMQSYFDMLAEETDIAGTLLKIETIPCTGKCNVCTEIFKMDFHNQYKSVCPKCKNKNIEIYTGLELILKNIEVEFDDEKEVTG